MTAAYNPFEILNLPMVRRLVQHGNHYIVLQRFNWPGIKEGAGFLATPYQDEASAKKHQLQLAEKEGKTLNLSADITKITDLVSSPKYYLFLNTFREEKWSEKILKHYQRNIISFLRSRMSIHSNDSIDIHLHLTFGRLKATVTANGPEHEFDAFDMIK